MASGRWRPGTPVLSFGRNPQFVSQWRWSEIKPAVKKLLSSRAQSLRRGEHDVDPFNPDQKFYGVKWGRMAPLLPGLRPEPFLPGRPPDEQDSLYRRDLAEVRQLGVFRPEGPTDAQIRIGLFWAYCGVRLVGTPSRLYNQILAQIIEADDLSVPETARTLALCNLAMSDAGIVCWEGKYRYQLWWPVIGIAQDRFQPARDWRPFGSPRTNPWQFALGDDARRLTALSMLGGGELNGLGDPAQDTLPYGRACFTPNFPSYPSADASFGSACFNMLKHIRAEREPTRQVIPAGSTTPGRSSRMRSTASRSTISGMCRARSSPENMPGSSI